jgi:3',5'-cyclic AMP phosphodiesterase CpdA
VFVVGWLCWSALCSIWSARDKRENSVLRVRETSQFLLSLFAKSSVLAEATVGIANMGFRFELQSLNWLAYLLDRSRPMPRLSDAYEERRLLEGFLLKLRTQFVASPRSELRIMRAAEAALTRLRNVSYDSAIPSEFFEELRNHLEIGPWAALIVPARVDQQVNTFLCSHEFLESLVREEHWPDAGIVLQPEEGILDRSDVIIDVFPAFRYALAETTEWPGMLFWTTSGEAAFLPFGSKHPSEIRARAGWMLSHLATSQGGTLKELKKEYLRNFSEARASSVITLLHLSDLHIGSIEASTRLGRLQQIVRNILRELPQGSKVVPIVTGDIMDDPNPRAYDEADRFFDFLHNLNTEEPVIVLGNHDVRREGYLEVDLSTALRFRTELVRWIDDSRIGLACFNSNMESQSDFDLATGKIGERQFQVIGNMIDRKREVNEYLMIALLHHHPMPVPRPHWYSQPLREKIFGTILARTVQLRDANIFKQFVRDRKFGAVLHGHEHIPRFDKIDTNDYRGIAVVGCGSSVGKVRTQDDEIYASLNIITINRKTSQMTARLAAQRISGGILRTTHEYVCEI